MHANNYIYICINVYTKKYIYIYIYRYIQYICIGSYRRSLDLEFENSKPDFLGHSARIPTLLSKLDEPQLTLWERKKN